MLRRGLLLLLAVPLVAAVHHFKDINSLQDFYALGFWDAKPEQGGKATKNILLGFADHQCVAEMRALGFPRDYGALGENFETGEVMLDRHGEVGQRFNVTGCKEFVFIPRGGNLSQYDRITAQGKLELNNWVFDHLHAEVTVMNDLLFDVELKWDSDKPGENFKVEVRSGETRPINTFFSHHFVVAMKQVGGAMKDMLRFRVDGDQTIRLSDYVGEASAEQCPASNSEQCERKPTDLIQLEKEDMSTWKNRDMNNVQRILRNENQPSSKPRFTKLGFKKARLPDPVYKLLRDHWEQGKDRAVVEPWSKSDCHTNFYEAPMRMVYLDDNQKNHLFEIMRPILEEWAGGVPLTPTSCYGIRSYGNGSVLREHCDTGDTHIISAIMQVAQDVDEDWELTIIDHNGDRHFISLEPGDMVFYESAVNIHGRPKPLNGRFFANTFIHYMPTDWKNGNRR